jgi:hypothetical protein
MMESHKPWMQHVEVSLKDYNQLYEKAYLNEKKAELEKERRALEEARKEQEEALEKKAKHLRDVSVEKERQREREQRGAVTSQNWLLMKHSVSGSYEPGSATQDSGLAELHFSLEFSVFEKEWTVIPLVDSQIITDEWRVQRTELLVTSDDGSEPAWAPVAFSSDTMLLVQELDGAPGRQVLATNLPGVYRVSFRAFVFVHSKRNLNSLGLNLLHPFAGMTLRLKHNSTSRALVRELSITPASQYTVEEGDDAITVSMKLPPTKNIEIKWRWMEKSDAEWERMNSDGAAEKVVEEEPMQVIVVHDALHTIMDAVLQSSHTLKFSMDSDQRALANVRFTVQGPARVTSVSGFGVMSWKSSAVSKDASTDSATLVEVSFKNSLISDTITLILNTELELGADAFAVPNVVCEGVLRQTGSIGIVKLANVEVHEHDARGMARISAEELPEHLRYQTNQPIMFAYKYLSPLSEAQLQVVKHEQVDVLEAVAESGFYQVLVSEGQSMHRLMLNMQNSRKQYLQVQGIPSDARLWSLMVNSKPAKPVRGSDGSLLIPLLVGMGGNNNEGAHFSSMEITYLIQREPLGNSGRIELSPPKLDVAISKLLMEVQWPSSHVATFKGTAQEVTRFSHALPKAVNHDVGTDVVPSNFDFNKLPAHVPRAGVNVHLPRAGDGHRFEQLLVVDGGAALSIDYEIKALEPQQQPGWLEGLQSRLCSRRR